ncbi:hypothetical protein [Candidatus Darwinibacter acetoxidans]
MAEHYRFFNSAAGDEREYTAAQFAEYFSRFLSDGLYTQDGKAGLKVTAGSGLSVDVAAGYAFVRGYMYHNDATINKALEPADSILDRIDRIVLRFDEVAREIKIDVLTGDFSSTPQPPEITVTDTVKELTLAQVLVRHGASTVTVTDERFSDTCGLVSSLIEVPTQEMWDAWNQALTQIESAWATQTADIDSDWADLAGGIGADWDTIKSDWQGWFESVQNDLGVRVLIGETEPADIQPGDLWFKVV